MKRRMFLGGMAAMAVTAAVSPAVSPVVPFKSAVKKSEKYKMASFEMASATVAGKTYTDSGTTNCH